MKRLLKVGLVVLLALVVGAVWGLMALRGSGQPVRDGQRSLAGLSAQVQVHWDAWGVPHIEGENEDDAIAALGWVHANDRMTQMELGRRAGQGRLAEILGESGVEADVYFRTLRFPATSEKMWQMASPRSRRLLEAYARGVNAWLKDRQGDLPPVLRLLGVEPEPWRPQDSLSFALLMARDLSFWNDRPEEERFRWLRHFGQQGVRDLLAESDLHVPEEILDLATASQSAPSGDSAHRQWIGDMPSPGSNNWALGGGHTASGQPLLANDPHLGLFLPSVWYQAMVRSPEYEAAGMTLPGTPGIVIGRGRHLAWAFTNTMLDDHDVFFERLDEDGTHYLRGDTWQALETHQEIIDLGDGEQQTLTLSSTDIGPLLDADPDRGLPPRSLAWTAHYGGDPVLALAQLASASTPDEVLRAIEPYTCPAQNLVVAFATGELMNTVLGRIPQRRGEASGEAPAEPAEDDLAAPDPGSLPQRVGLGRLPAPAWDPAYGWQGLRPRSSNPVRILSAEDLLITANHDIRPANYPLPLVADFFTPHRADRIEQLLAQRQDWTLEDFKAVQLDVRSLYARDIVAALESDRDALTGDALAAFEALEAWDGEMAPKGPAALFALVERQLMLKTLGDEAQSTDIKPFADRAMLLRLMVGAMDERWFDDAKTEIPETRQQIVSAALAEAWQDGQKRWGADVAGWDFGALHTLTLRHRLDAVPGLGKWFRRGPFPVAGSATTIAAFGSRWQGERQEVTYGPSMRWIVDWSAPDRAWAAIPGGQSGHGADAHYDDQIEDFLAGELHVAPWSTEAIQEVTVSTLTLRP